MSICAKNDILILSFTEMVTKRWKIKKRGRHIVILDYFTVWTSFIAIDYINTDFDHRLNELFS